MKFKEKNREKACHFCQCTNVSRPDFQSGVGFVRSQLTGCGVDFLTIKSGTAEIMRFGLVFCIKITEDED